MVFGMAGHAYACHMECINTDLVYKACGVCPYEGGKFVINVSAIAVQLHPSNQRAQM